MKIIKIGTAIFFIFSLIEVLDIDLKSPAQEPSFETEAKSSDTANQTAENITPYLRPQENQTVIAGSEPKESPESVTGKEKPLPKKELLTSDGELEYTIGQGDVLDISVWEWPDLAKTVIVRPDGRISFPLIGDLRVSGLTLTELDNQITENLKDYILSPEVSVMLKEFGGRKVILLGEVTAQGVYQPKGDSTVLEAIALSGGFTNDAVTSSVIIIRNVNKEPEAMRLNLSRALSGRDIAKNNISLQSQDIVYVPKKFIADLNYFLTQIVGPISQASTVATSVKTVQEAINLYHKR